jgi:hypothetical protein
MSSFHAKVTLTEAGVHLVKDNNTKHGTYVNGNVIPQDPAYELKHGDKLTFGGPDKVFIRRPFDNPFHFEYRRPLNLTEWQNEMTDDWEECRPKKRAKVVGEAPDLALAWNDEHVSCVICNEVFVDPYSTPCGHTFCHSCVTKWVSERSKCCPICRHTITMPLSSSLRPNLTVRALLEYHVFPRLSAEVIEARLLRSREICAQLQRHEPASPQPHGAAGSNTQIAPQATAMMVRLSDISGEGLMALRQRVAQFIHESRHDALPPPPVGPADWKAVSSGTAIETPCDTCHGIIPARFLRLRRTLTVGDARTHQYFHTRLRCVGFFRSELRAATDLCGLSELTEQEQRIMSVVKTKVC